ncbi:helix-turn-helix transcriptional regulator [Brevibacillus humidisoli]|uniref:helix-turn-helix domain-containing protein n=1 Tax=Brevibacillus humidisoli TaxID=2895522 RepID=UPI001E4573CF|nr:helix-turn-helix transcriptional regulator [Brevibacillus humidisoli]UFJ41319.1 helix-turn-helix transcriptional regulator [Brevibacillus humidisoli]
MHFEDGITVKEEFFQNYLKQNNMSEGEFAELIGISHSMLNRVLNKKRKPGSKFIAGVLKHCNVKFEDAFIFEKLLPKGNDKSSA